MLLFKIGIRIMGHPRIQDNGFTIIEAIAVLLIIGVIGSVVLISWIYSTSVYDLTSQTEVIKSHLRYAQARAMNTNAVWGIDFATPTSYFLFKESPANKALLPGEDSDTISPIPGEINVTTGTVYFDSRGKPYTAAPPSVESSTINITTSLGENPPETITITQNTGFIP